MTSLFQRFRDKKTPAMKFTLQWPKPQPAHTDEEGVEHPEVVPQLEVTVRRIPPVEEMNIEMEASGLAKTGGHVGDDAETLGVRYGLKCWCYAMRLPRYAESWKALDGGETPTFTQADFEKLVHAMSDRQRVQLGSAYIDAVTADKKKFEAEASSETAS